MEQCKDCIHEKICHIRANIQTDTYAYMGISYDTKSCEHFKQTADVVKMLEANVVPKSEAEKWFRECEKLQGRMIELESEVAREIFDGIEKIILENTYPYFDKDGKPCNIWKAKSGYYALDELKKKYEKKKQ